MAYEVNMISFRSLSPAGFLLLVSLFATEPAGIFDRPAYAQQNQDYRVCMVTRTPVVEGIQGSLGYETYYSLLYQGPDRSKEFLKWLNNHYKKQWMREMVPYRYVEDASCYFMSSQNFSDSVKKIEARPSLKPLNIFTAWPAETGDLH
jgi:hypothetical protein